MRLSAPFRIVAAGIVLVLLLVAVVAREDRARGGGREVLLPMEAVDPRDLLTGHYVALNLAQQLGPGQSCPKNVQTYEEGRWLALAAAGGHHRFAGAAPTREAALKLGDVALRGGVYCSRMAFGEGERNAVTLDIGVDRFHADQDEAQAIEAALRARRPGEAAPSAYAVVSVGADGRARLKGVIVGGKRAELSWW